MKLNKVAFAVASVLAIASGYSHAGQIDSSSATLAIEVIKNNAQVVRAPSKSYSFAGNIDARTNEQRLQLQWTLAKGTWATGAGTLIPTANALVALPAVLSVNYRDGANAGQTTLPAGSTVDAFVTNGGKTLAFNVTIPAAAGDVNVLNAPTFSINRTDNVTTPNSNIGLTGLADVAGVTACVAPDANMDINFKHFTNHNGAASLQTIASPDSEHLRGGATNDARLLNFTQNLKLEFVAAATSSRTDANFLNQRLVGNNWTGATNLLGAALVPPTAAAVAPVTRHYLGAVSGKLVANGLDLDYIHQYGNADATAGFTAADFDDADDIGNLADGKIELNAFNITVVLPTAWPANTVVFAVDAAGAAIPGATVATTAGQTTITIPATSAAAAATLMAGGYLFADFPGTALIPQTTSIGGTATLAKDTVAGTPDLREQDNMCTGNLTGIGGGIKIDVRNYASFATFGASGPATTIRLINNSEGNAADVFGQLIYADGTYGAWGKLADLKPREILNMRNEEIEAKLVNAPSATNPFGSATSYSFTAGTAIKGGTKAGMSDRLRIVSNNGTTLRVQSYMVVGNSVIDTSNAQGVDFENNGDRVPENARDSQPVSQDAINGLSKSN
jgi:hypothetical protein